MHSRRLIRNVANVANLSTPLGLLLAVAGRGRLRMVDDLVVADKVRLPRRITASAVTVGSVVLVPRRSLAEAQQQIPALLRHEDNHAWQYAYCLGLPFLPLYAAATGWSWLRSGDRASANHFEVQAGLAAGGYRAREKRPRHAGIAGFAGRLGRPTRAADGPIGRPGAGSGVDAAA